MKKKVRIYRAPDGQGAVINKTAKFLKKAQEGGMPDPDMMGYPGAQQQGEMSEDQIAQSIVIDISNGRPKEETVVKLVQVLGQDPMVASQYYDQIYSALESQKEEMEDEADEDSEEQPIKEEIALSEPQEEIEEDFYGDDSNTDMANEIAAEDDGQDFDDDDQVASDIIMQFGGVSPVFAPIRQDGGESYPIQFPGVEAYLPFNMSEMLSGEVDPLTGQAWSPQAEAQAAVAPDDEVQTDFRKGGQYKKDKKVYVNSMLKLAKKQMGGEDMSKKGDTDPRGEDVRKERLNAFIGTVKNEAQLAKIKEQAEQQYDQMMQQQQMMQQNPMQQSMEPPMAQFGMQMRRGLFGRPRMPRGVGFGYGMPISKIDVRRTGIFGRPKQYSIEFGMPGSVMPGYGAGFYGYGQTSTTKKTKSKGRIITETIAGTVNNEAIKEVANSTNSNAANTSAQTWDKDNNGIPDNIQSNVIQSEKKIGEDWIYNSGAAAGSGVLSNNPSTPGTTANNVQVNTAESNKRKGVEVNNEAADAILNNSNAKRDQLKGASLRPDIESYAKKATGKKDKWGRPEGSKWYGFDPVKKKYTQGSPSKNLINLNPVTINPFSANNVVPFGYQEGGLVDSPMPDQFGNLQQFVYGGNDPYITQADIDDVYSKDTSDPYFQDGGGYEDYRKRVGDKLQMSLRDDLSAKELFEMGQKAGVGFGDDNTTTTTKKKTTTTDYEDSNPYPNIGYNGFNVFGNLFPANIASYQGSWGKVKRGPYNKATGAMMSGVGFGPNTQVKSIDVTKSGIFGRPKRYTVNFSNQEMDPRKQNLITLPGQGTPGSQGYSGQETAKSSGSDKFSNTKGLKAGTRAKVAMKELFNRYNDEEEVQTGDEALNNNEPSPKQIPVSDEDEAAKFQHQQRQRGKRWDEEKQAWVDADQIRMDIKKPSLLSPSESLARAKYEEAIKSQGSRADQNRPIGNVSYEQRNRRISPSKEKLNELYNRDVMQQQYGGDLSRFTGAMQQFPNGGSPVTYTDNPALVGMSNVDMISLNEGIPGLGDSSLTSFMNTNAPTRDQSQDPKEVKIDPTQISSDQAKKEYQGTPGDYSMDFKVKNMYEIDPEAAINVANAGVRGVTGMIERMRNKKREAKMYDNLTADNLYAADPSRDRGDYDVNTGLYRPNEQGAVHTSRSAQYGGSLYQDGGYYDEEEDDVAYMSEDQIKDFLANGGEIEYL